MELELEDVIDHLTANNRMKIQDIWKKLGLDRSSFQSQRRSTTMGKKAELTEAIIAAFPEHFTDDQMEKLKVKGSSGMEKKIVALMERTITELREDRDRLRTENEKLLNEIHDLLKQIKARVFD